MINLIHNKIAEMGLNNDMTFPLAYLAFVLGVVIVAIITDFLAKKIILRTLRKFIRRSRFRWDDVALKKRIFHRLSHLAPALVFYLAAPLFAIEDLDWTQNVSEVIKRVSMVYFVVVAIMVGDAVLNTVLQVYRNFEVAKSKPIRSYVQVGKIFLFFLGAILILSVLLNKSPWAFLTGLGALAAILLLVFKDSILGLVASVQNAAYDTVRMGDWIEMPKYGADGDVIELSLNALKVQNFDKTIVTIPTAALLTEGVKNWRGMNDAGGRRIKRHINIDMNTVRFCDAKMLDRYSKYEFIKEYIEAKKAEVSQYNQERQIDTSTLVNGRHLTNIGTFRAYVEAYLKNHSQIHKELTFLVRQLQPTPMGIPIEIYVFTTDTRWTVYEAIQADIFDHILAVAPLFDLALFQNTSGQNYKIDIVSTPEAKSAS